VNGDGRKDLLLQAKTPDEKSLLVLDDTTQSVATHQCSIDSLSWLDDAAEVE
jgi:hypothetical protein